MSSDNAGDVFDEDGDWRSIEDVFWEKMKISRKKDGFADGKYLGEIKSSETGFSEGYQKGFECSYNISVLRGIIGALETHLKNSSSTREDLMQKCNDIKTELVQLECKCIELKKTIAMFKIVELQNDEFNAEDESDSNKSPEYNISENAGVLCIKNKKNKVVYEQDINEISSWFESIQKRSVELAEECGYTKLTELIMSVSFCILL